MKRSCVLALVFVLVEVCGVLGSGTRGIAELLKALESDGTRLEAIRELEDLGLDAAPAVPQLIRLLDARDADTRSAAADALGAIGKDATPAIPKLIERLGEGQLPRIATELPITDTGVHAAFALGQIGNDAVAFLVPCLTNPRSAVRCNAACVLGMIGPSAKDAVTTLMGQLKDRDWLVRQCAVEALGRIRADPSQTIPALVESLIDENDNVRRFAAAALGEIQPTTPAGVEGLIGALRDKRGEVQNEAAQALAKLGAAAVPAIPMLAKMLKSREMFVEGHPGEFQPVAQGAARALGIIGPPAKDVLPTLLDVVRDTKGTFDVLGNRVDNREVRAEAAVAAVRINPQSDELVRVLGRSLEEDGGIADKIALALALVGPKAKNSVPSLLRIANSESSKALNCACAAVVIEPDNPAAVKTLLECLPPKLGPFDNDDWTLLRTALAKGDAGSRLAVPILIEVVKDVSADQANAARTLAAFGPEAQIAIPALLDLLCDRWEEPRQTAIAAIQDIASENSTPLLAALKHPNSNVRSGAVEVLGRFPGALPLLTEALSDPSTRVRLAALLSLAKLEIIARPAVPKICGLLRAESRTLREAAAFALQHIEPPGTLP
jgi:HEAT repeat protein